MAKTTAPLFSQTASGSIAGTVTMLRQFGRNIAKRTAAPTGAPSPAQTARRNRYAAHAALWSTFSTFKKSLWNADAARLQITPYNAFLRDTIGTIRTLPLVTPDVYAPLTMPEIQAGLTAMKTPLDGQTFDITTSFRSFKFPPLTTTNPAADHSIHIDMRTGSGTLYGLIYIDGGYYTFLNSVTLPTNTQQRFRFRFAAAAIGNFTANTLVSIGAYTSAGVCTIDQIKLVIDPTQPPPS